MKPDTASQSQSVEKIWLRSYPKDVPAEVDVGAYSSIVGVLQHSVEQFRQNPSFANMGTTLTYGDLDRLTVDFAAYLQQELGLTKGDTIAIMMPNLLQYPIALFGALRAGLTVTNINPLYTPRELKNQLTDSGARCIVIVENFCHTLEQVLAETAVKTIITTRLGDMLKAPKSILVNFVVKHVKKLVPAYHLPETVSFRRALELGSRRR